MGFLISFELREGWQFSDTDGDAVPCSKSRIMEAFFHIVKVISWNLDVPAVSHIVV